MHKTFEKSHTRHDGSTAIAVKCVQPGNVSGKARYEVDIFGPEQEVLGQQDFRTEDEMNDWMLDFALSS